MSSFFEILKLTKVKVNISEILFFRYLTLPTGFQTLCHIALFIRIRIYFYVYYQKEKIRPEKRAYLYQNVKNGLDVTNFIKVNIGKILNQTIYR